MSPRARRYFGCVLPLVLSVFGCCSLAMLAYAGQVVIQIVPVHDESMAPVLLPGWRVLVNNTAFWAREPELGSIINLGSPAGAAMRRLYALPGSTVQIRDGVITVNGERSRVLNRAHGDLSDYGPVTLGPDEYFLLAEDRNYPDSRTWGPIKRDQLFGVALLYFQEGGWSAYPVDPTPTPGPRLTPGATP
jgi:signal peptidase I